MSVILSAIRPLVAAGDVVVSAHGQKELDDDGIELTDLAATIALPVAKPPDTRHKNFANCLRLTSVASVWLMGKSFFQSWFFSLLSGIKTIIQ